MNILLVNPSWGATVHRQRYNRRWPPLDLLNVAAKLRGDGFGISLLDARASGRGPEEASREAERAGLVVVSTSPLDRWQCPNIDLQPLLPWTRITSPDRLILYGAHGTVFPEEILEMTGARAVVRGEPEEAVPLLCRMLERGRESWEDVPSVSFRKEGRVHHNPPGKPVDLAAMPLPAYDLVRPDDYEYELLGERLAVLETSRGCPHRCSYCMKEMYGPGVRFKPVAQVGAELERVIARGFRHVYFIDLEFSVSRRRVLELCRMLRAMPLRWCCQTRVDAVDPELLREMAAAGCRLIHYGIESGAESMRQDIRKGIDANRIEEAVRWTKDCGIATAGFFLFGFPGESASMRKATEDLARRLNLTYASFHSVTPYPGTLLGRLTGKVRPWWESAGEPGKPGEDLRRVYLRYYLRPAYWMEFLRRGACRFAAVRLFAQFLGSDSPPPRSTGRRP
ncbi:MAG: radical SAM protein [Syntrophobacteraceae bacterium]|nr:B12-binding domain-containing radical SAM protein [Desulfobacteraceae bacterium]